MRISAYVSKTKSGGKGLRFKRQCWFNFVELACSGVQIVECGVKEESCPRDLNAWNRLCMLNRLN